MTTPSKETLEAIAEAIERVALTLPKASGRETTLLFAQAAFTAVMQSKEVRELVDACNAFFNTEVEFPGAENYKLRLDMLGKYEERVRAALRPFTPTNEAEDE